MAPWHHCTLNFFTMTRDVTTLGSVVKTPGSRSAGVTGQPLDDATCNDLTGVCGSGERNKAMKVVFILVLLVGGLMGILFPELRRNIGALIGSGVSIAWLCVTALADKVKQR
jgi:hypothetical protein